jgi:hypothetical protein
MEDEDLLFDFSRNDGDYDLIDYAQRIQDGLNAAERRAQARLIEHQARLRMQEIQEKTWFAEQKMHEQAIVDAMLFLDEQEKSTRRGDFIRDTERMLEEYRRTPLPPGGYTL